MMPKLLVPVPQAAGTEQLCPTADEHPLEQQRLRAVGPRGSFPRHSLSLFLFPGPGQQSHAVHGQLAEKANCREQFSLPIQPIFAKARWAASKHNDSARAQHSQAEQGLGERSKAL